jgi:hypothetical protein
MGKCRFLSESDGNNENSALVGWVGRFVAMDFQFPFDKPRGIDYN